MNQYTQTPMDVSPRAYDGNGNPIRTGAALPASYRHDFLDRITQAVGMPDVGGGSVPIGSEFSDDFATDRDAAWELNPANFGGLPVAQWPWNAGGHLEHSVTAPNYASSALPRSNPDGDFWWVYTRPSGASGNDVLDAYLRITGQNTDTTFDAEFLKLDIDADGISLWREGTGGQLANRRGLTPAPGSSTVANASLRATSRAWVTTSRWPEKLAARCKRRAKARTRIFDRNQGAKPREIRVFSRLRNAKFGQKDRS